MNSKFIIAWEDPLTLFNKLAISSNEVFAFLYSGSKSEFSGDKSYLFLDPISEIKTDDFAKFSIDKGQTLVGYFSYELKNQFETLPFDSPSYINFPLIWLHSFATIYCFDHKTKQITVTGTPRELTSPKDIIEPSVKEFWSNFEKADYLKKVAIFKDYIKAGDIYEANLTNKHWGDFTTEPCGKSIFLKLCNLNAGIYSALMSFGEGKYIISSSPEQFISLEKEGLISTRPIKGSVKRDPDPIINEELINDVLLDEKNQAENLMIVDLMRNDLTKIALPGTIKVPKLFEVGRYKTINHLYSLVTAQKDPKTSISDFLKATFPPGSMTGAPKIRAMEICSEVEKLKRGIYSGALGWIKPDELELSVVIRTIIIDQHKFEFQTGGAITYDSDPQSEYEEHLIKAAPLAKTLNINIS